MVGILTSPWLIRSKGDGTFSAAHLSGLELLVSASGLITVIRQPREMPVSKATELMNEARTLVAARRLH